jgi:hypothetical protein
LLLKVKLTSRLGLEQDQLDAGRADGTLVGGRCPRVDRSLHFVVLLRIKRMASPPAGG